jgi:hypothetical protein
MVLEKLAPTAGGLPRDPFSSAMGTTYVPGPDFQVEGASVKIEPLLSCLTECLPR